MVDVQKNLLVASLQHSDPARCVQLTRNPSSHVFYALRSKLQESNPAWIAQFLDQGGLDSLLDSVEQLSGRLTNVTNFSDAVLQLDCLECVRTLLNSRCALQYIADDQTLITKLVTGIDTSNSLAKKHVFELLTAVSVFSARGHSCVAEALNHYHKVADLSQTGSVLMGELKQADTPTYKRSLVAFLNAFLCGHTDIHARNRVRSELTGLGLLDVLHHMRTEENDPDLLVQLEVFYDGRHKDDMELEHRYRFDYNSPTELFAALLNQTLLETDIRADFLHILQDLYRLHTSSKQHISIWRMAASLTNEITNRGLQPDAHKFVDKFTDFMKTISPGDSHTSDNHGNNTAPNQHCQEDNVWIKAPQNSNVSDEGDGSSVNRDSGISVCSNLSFYDNVGAPFLRQGSGRGSGGNAKAPSLQVVGEFEVLDSPKPKRPTKLVHWAKVTAEQANRPVSIWRQMQEDIRRRRSILNFSTLEEEFADNKRATHQAGEVNLLSSSKRLPLNLFLARIEAVPEVLANCLIEGHTENLGYSGLHALLSVMPSENEVAQIRSYRGSRFDLAPAEQFLLKLSDCPFYRPLLEGLTLRAKLALDLPRLHASLHTMIKSTRDVIHHPGIRDFFSLALQAGNFLNADSYIGKAAGIRLDTLKQLNLVKSADSNRSLLFHLVQRVRDEDIIMLSFLKAFPDLKEASKYSLPEVKNEVNQLTTDLKKFVTNLPCTSSFVRNMLQAPLSEMKKTLQTQQENINQLQCLSNQMAHYFCEDTATFDLQAGLKEVHNLCLMIKACDKEVTMTQAHRPVMEDYRHQLRESRTALAFGNRADACSSFCGSQSEAVVDSLLQGVHLGEFPHVPNQDCHLAEPESVNSSLMLSHIQTSTPCRGLDETVISFCVNDLKMSPGRKTYVDRVEQITARQYHRDKQMTTASYINPDIKARLPMSKVAEDQNVPLQINFYPKMTKETDMRGEAAMPLAVRRHRRTNSDLDRSRRTEDKWKAYHQGIETGKVWAVPKAESEDVLLSLGLATNGNVLDNDELEETLVVQEQNKPKKRTSIGFFKRFTSLRATLTQRNSDGNKPREKKAKSKAAKNRVTGKENVAY